MAQVVKIETEQTNKHFTLRNPFGEALSIDQSIAHNGVCLTVVKIEGDLYTVTAMQETLRLTNLDLLNAHGRPLGRTHRTGSRGSESRLYRRA